MTGLPVADGSQPATAIQAPSSAPHADSATTLLITEYERSSEFCNHVDDVRNVITSFFLTVVGGALFAIDRYASGQIKSGSLGSPAARVSFLLGGVAMIGVLFVMTIARLRRVQLERYKMMNGILDHVLSVPGQRSLIVFTNSRIPGIASNTRAVSKRLAGSYIWTVILMVPTAAIAGIAAFLGFRTGVRSQLDLATAAGLTVPLVMLVGCDWIFWRLSRI